MFHHFQLTRLLSRSEPCHFRERLILARHDVYSPPFIQYLGDVILCRDGELFIEYRYFAPGSPVAETFRRLTAYRPPGINQRLRIASRYRRVRYFRFDDRGWWRCLPSRIFVPANVTTEC